MFFGTRKALVDLIDKLGYMGIGSDGHIRRGYFAEDLPTRVKGLEREVEKLSHLQSGEPHHCKTCGKRFEEGRKKS